MYVLCNGRVFRAAGLTAVVALALCLGGCMSPSEKSPSVSVVTPTAVASSLPSTPFPTATPAPQPFSMVWMSDTQYYPQKYPDILPAMTEWIAQNREKLGIAAVLHAGDLAQNCGVQLQQQRVREAFALLPQDLRVITAGGNHDRRSNAPYYRSFSIYRPDTDYSAGRASDDGSCYYSTFSVSGVPFIVVSVSYLGESDNTAWMRTVLQQHDDHYGILLIHSYMQQVADAVQGKKSEGWTLFTDVVEQCSNLRLVLCGHMYGSLYWPVSLDDDHDGTPDRTVHQLLFNPQEERRGGDGYLTLLTFHPDADSIDVQMLSPLSDAQPLPQDEFALQSFTLPNAGLAQTEKPSSQKRS